MTLIWCVAQWLVRNTVSTARKRQRCSGRTFQSGGKTSSQKPVSSAAGHSARQASCQAAWAGGWRGVAAAVCVLRGVRWGTEHDTWVQAASDRRRRTEAGCARTREGAGGGVERGSRSRRAMWTTWTTTAGGKRATTGASRRRGWERRQHSKETATTVAELVPGQADRAERPSK